MFALLIFGILSFYRNGIKALFIVVPSIAYNLGTMLLLCGNIDVRFFHFNVVITLPLVLVLLAKQKPNDVSQPGAALAVSPAAPLL
jgi:hypothetical protein